MKTTEGTGDTEDAKLSQFLRALCGRVFPHRISRIARGCSCRSCRRCSRKPREPEVPEQLFRGRFGADFLASASRIRTAHGLPVRRRSFPRQAPGCSKEFYKETPWPDGALHPPLE